FSSQNGCISAGMTDFIAAQADLILPELVGGYAPEYVTNNDVKVIIYLVFKIFLPIPGLFK
ncbi:hypothetical protein, partial [Macellibacteroides fermentans]|uniref:hypothetical protein n=1 Tax=Macellibacteroides fermentans TaxID=879969 RepID=UPI00352FAA8D